MTRKSYPEPTPKGKPLCGFKGAFARRDWIGARQDIPSVPKSVLFGLERYASFDTGFCYPTVTTLSRFIGYKSVAVRSGLKWLRTHGFIEVFYHTGSYSGYILLDTPTSNVGLPQRLTSDYPNARRRTTPTSDVAPPQRLTSDYPNARRRTTPTSDVAPPQRETSTPNQGASEKEEQVKLTPLEQEAVDRRRLVGTLDRARLDVLAKRDDIAGELARAQIKILEGELE